MDDIKGYIPHQVYWRGTYYPPGVALVPGELAIALGLTPIDQNLNSKSTTPIDPSIETVDKAGTTPKIQNKNLKA